MSKQRHLKMVGKSPQQAQTVQQLKYETLLVYLTNGFDLILGNMVNLAEVSNSLEGFIGALPYKGVFGGGGGTDTGGGDTTTT